MRHKCDSRNETYMRCLKMRYTSHCPECTTYIALHNYRFAVQVDARRGDSKCDVCGILPMRCIRHVDTDAIYIAMKR